jgi:hypothetical protein
MDDVSCLEVVTAGDPRFTGMASREAAAFLWQSGSGRTVNDTIDTAPAQQAGVGGIHDGVHL